MEEELVFDPEIAKEAILKKFLEKGDFSEENGFDAAAMVDVAVETECAYMEEADVFGEGAYDDDEAYEKILAAVKAAFEDKAMYAMRFTEDYLEYSEAYMEEAGFIAWE